MRLGMHQVSAARAPALDRLRDARASRSCWWLLIAIFAVASPASPRCPNLSEHPDPVDHPAAARAADDADHHDRRARSLDGRGAHARRRSCSPMTVVATGSSALALAAALAVGLAFGAAQRLPGRAARHSAVRRDARHARHRAGPRARGHRRAERRRHPRGLPAGLCQHVRRRADPDPDRRRGLSRCFTSLLYRTRSAPTSSRSAATAKR